MTREEEVNQKRTTKTKKSEEKNSEEEKRDRDGERMSTWIEGIDYVIL